MRAVWQAVVFLFVVIFISLLYALPAKFVYQQLPSNSSIQLVGISGSIWSGRVEQIHSQDFILENLDWRLSFFNLLLGEAAIIWSLKDAAASASGELVLSSSQLIVKNTQGQVDLLSVMQRLPSQEVLLGGIVNFDINEFNFKQQSVFDVAGVVEWQQAELLAPENIILGGFKAHLSDEAGRLLIQISDTDGAVFTQGSMKISTQGVFQYSMQVGVRDTSARGLIDGFNQLGQPDEDGNITLRGSGNLF